MKILPFFNLLQVHIRTVLSVLLRDGIPESIISYNIYKSFPGCKLMDSYFVPGIKWA